MGPDKTIMTISRDAALQDSRTLLLESAGYVVVPLLSDAEVVDVLRAADKPELNLVLLCHSVPEASRVKLCKALKQAYPDCPILMLYNEYDPTEAQVDGRLENMHSPKALVDMIQMLVSHPTPT